LTSIVGTIELTPRQREAVAYRGGNLLVEAVPGSGKTRVIVERCAALLADGVAPSQILLLTFSRRAVGELRARLLLVLANDALPDIRTFHGFAARLLADAGNSGRSRRLLSEPAGRALFERVATTTPLTSLPGGIGRSPHFRDAAAVCVDAIRRSPTNALARLSECATPRVADLLALDAGQKTLRERLGVANYDDLVAQAATLASTPGSVVANALHGRYRHVLVDEFQDTDPLQLALLEQLHAEIFAVGDAAQAIYGFRGAARNALGRARTSLAMTTLSLDESFRCPANICDLASSVWPSSLPLHSRIAETGEIAFRRAASPQDEAALVGDAVAAAIDSGTPEREIAVLVRSAEPAARLGERELRARGITVARQGGENVLDDLAVDAICAALKAFSNPAASERWVQLLGHPVLGVAPLTLRLALDAAPPHSVEDACKLLERLDTRARVSGAQIARALHSAHAFWSAGEPVRAARSFAAEADVLGFVIASNENDAQRSGGHIVSLLDALGDVRDVRARLGLDTSSSAVFAAFLECSESWRAGAQDVDDEPGVRILTIHAAKGLEFTFVIIADAVDGRFPQPWRTDALLNPDDLKTARACGVDLGTRREEHDAQERSLWYVAVTRSKRKLLVSWSEAERDGSPQRASRFIPLDARTKELQAPSFRGRLEYTLATTLAVTQAPTSAHLGRPLRTSAMETWLSCRRQFYYSALLRIGSDERGFKAKLGTLVHRAIERFHLTVRDFRTVEDGAHIAWSSSLRDVARSIVATDATFPPFDSPLETDAALRAAERLLDRYARELETSARARDGGFEVVASEEHVSYAIEGIAFSGKIDRIDRRADGSLALVDVKTGAFRKEKAMADAFPKLAAAATDGMLWIKATPGNPQLALYRHAKPETGTLAYVYLDARPKFGEFVDAAHADRLDVAQGAKALADIDGVLSQTFFVPWTTGAVTSLEPTRNARTCRYCEFVNICPGYLEDDD
jgi:DNA helicase-2/ATP-dependent DNA helicase PcrA